MAWRHHSSRALWRYPYILAGIFGKLTGFPHITHGKALAWLSLLLNPPGANISDGISLPCVQSLAEFGILDSRQGPGGEQWCLVTGGAGLGGDARSVTRHLGSSFTTFSFPVFLPTELATLFFLS